LREKNRRVGERRSHIPTSSASVAGISEFFLKEKSRFWKQHCQGAGCVLLIKK
jgi:hypothetical protein